MTRIEKAIVVVACVYMLLYIPYFTIQMYRVTHTFAEPPLLTIAIPHFTGMALNFAALIVTFRDLYRRPFPDPSDKLTWGLLILLTGGIGWLVHLFKFAFKPRVVA